ncbi:MAG: endonuclease III [Bacteroidales bacterium]|nr:endonuclease III [Bacteroidales bacterium]MBQ7238367.1 endonuclease III [Bacteroidales bacterium]
MTLSSRYSAILAYFQEHNPNAQTELVYHNPFELLVAVILSAQCTDKRVNMVTPDLLRAFPTAQKMAEQTPDEVFEYIKSISYPHNKAQHLVGMAQRLVNDYGGEVPEDYDALLSLPGVGRKTANVISSVIYNKPTMAVDTHVFRVANRLGLTNNSRTPLETEKTLTKNIPAHLIPLAHHWLILHGRYVCTARNPKCDLCEIRNYCKFVANIGKK